MGQVSRGRDKAHIESEGMAWLQDYWKTLSSEQQEVESKKGEEQPADVDC